MKILNLLKALLVRKSFVDGDAGIEDESHLQSLGKAGGAAEISHFEQNQYVQGSVGEF